MHGLPNLKMRTRLFDSGRTLLYGVSLLSLGTLFTSSLKMRTRLFDSGRTLLHGVSLLSLGTLFTSSLPPPKSVSNDADSW